MWVDNKDEGAIAWVKEIHFHKHLHHPTKEGMYGARQSRLKDAYFFIVLLSKK